MPGTLRALGIRPSKRLGQNFLIDPRVAERIASLIRDPLEPVLEIGPGLGALSLSLASTGRPFAAVELDLRLAEHMERELRPFPHARLVRGDILEQRIVETFPEVPSVSVVANLPYSITSPALEWILAQSERVRRALLMVQREFAERLTAEPGSKEYGPISVFVGLNATVEKRFRVSPGAFHPRPEVESMVLEAIPRPFPGTSAEERDAAARLARASMGTRRKMLANALAQGLGSEGAQARDLAEGSAMTSGDVKALLERAGIDPGRRGETLSIQEFVGLARVWLASGGRA